MFTNFGTDTQYYTSPAGWTEPITTGRALSMCGTCNWPTALHPITDEFTGDLICDDEFTNGLRSGYDFFLHSTSVEGVKQSITIYEDYSGNEANILNLTDGVDYDNEDGTFTNYRIEDDPTTYVNYDELESDAIDRWIDRDSNVCTHAIGEWSYTNLITGEVLTGTYDDLGYDLALGYSKHHMPRNTKFTEGTFEPLILETPEGTIDLNTTTGFQYRLLNAFTHKRTGNFHVGSIEFTFDGPDVIATCINKECYRKDIDGSYKRAAVTINRDLAERPMMEEFIYNVIRHGNNHGPDWLISRSTKYTDKFSWNSTVIYNESDRILMEYGLTPAKASYLEDTVANELRVADWYKLHAIECDLTCGTGIACNSNRVVTDNLDTELSDVEFVLAHQAYCHDKNCKCDEWLANEVPALKESAA